MGIDLTVGYSHYRTGGRDSGRIANSGNISVGMAMQVLAAMYGPRTSDDPTVVLYDQDRVLLSFPGYLSITTDTPYFEEKLGGPFFYDFKPLLPVDNADFMFLVGIFTHCFPRSVGPEAKAMADRASRYLAANASAV